MQTIGLFEAKQRLSELVARAEAGEPIGITRHGVLKAVLTPAPHAAQRPLAEVFASLRGSLTLPKGVHTKDLVREGRRQ